ncbi:type VI secretion system protein IglI family protein [Facilibium subflavum]|uniref:type VI secretion system protein IglI family protein n=1 Tax=Facilibium subflavum TaxID=2219058 RepID=UPI000E64AD20|nr:type VI secretion system protein IglI family protein [Facilibium subflavum]
MSILAYLQGVDELQRHTRVNPMLMSVIIKAHQEGDYTQCQQAIQHYIEQTNTLDVYILYIAFATDIYLYQENLETLQTKINVCFDLLKQHQAELSPIENFEATLIKGIDAFCHMLEMHVDGKIKTTKPFDVKSLLAAVQDFLSYSAGLGQLDIESQQTVINLNKTLHKLERFIDRLSSEDQSDKPSEKNTSDDSTKKEKRDQTQDKNNTQWVDQFASADWYRLIKKIAIFQNLVKQKRLFEASIVYQDIQGKLLEFDPKKYFPGLFFPLYKTLGPNIRKIYEYIDVHANSLQWHIAQKMYEVDDMRFLQDMPVMVENKYNAEQFTEGSLDESVENQNRQLLADVESLPDDHELQFPEEDNTVDSNVAHGVDEDLDQILEDIESIWDSADMAQGEKTTGN